MEGLFRGFAGPGIYGTGEHGCGWDVGLCQET